MYFSGNWPNIPANFFVTHMEYMKKKNSPLVKVIFCWGWGREGNGILHILGLTSFLQGYIKGVIFAKLLGWSLASDNCFPSAPDIICAPARMKLPLANLANE